MVYYFLNFPLLLLMSSFELVNQKLKHIFGGIQPEINGSIQYLYNEHKRISNTLNTQSQIFRKFHSACQIIKQCSSELLQIYKNQLKQNQNVEVASLDAMINDISKNWGNMGQQVMQLKNKVDVQLEHYLPAIKKLYAEHKETAEELQHYKQKILLLHKRVGNYQNVNASKKQVTSQQIERYQRNQLKLQNSQTKYDEIVQKLTKKQKQFINSGEVIFIKNYSDFLSTVVTMHENLRKNINKWLRVNQSKCVCQTDTTVKQKFNKLTQKEQTQHKPLTLNKLFQKIDGFKILNNAFCSQQTDSKVTAKRTIDLRDKKDIMQNNTAFFYQRQQHNEKEHEPAKSQVIKNSKKQLEFDFFETKSNAEKQNKEEQSVKMSQISSNITNQPSTVQKKNKANFSDFMDLLNM